MRQAVARASLNKLTRDRRFGLTELKFSAKAPLADVESVELANGMTVICGLNGVGKSTLLRLIEGALADVDAFEATFRPGLADDGDFTVTLQLDDTANSFGLDDTQHSPTIIIDAFVACARILEVTAQKNFDDLLEGISPHIYTGDEIEDATYVVGKAYERVEVFEVEEPDVEDSVLPYFRATVAGTEYDARHMGLGELAALFSLWSIARAEPASVLLLEEPETFLSSHAAVALFDVLARTIVDRRLYAVLTTHSAGIVARAPLEVLRLLTPMNGGVRVKRPSSLTELELLLGSFVGEARVALVEDRTAAVVVSEILGRCAGLWGQAVEVLSVANGESEIVDVCRKAPAARRMRLIGILDGDQSLPQGTIWPVLRLPPPKNPDAMLRTAAVSDVEGFAHALRRTYDAVYNALQPVTGIDDHDWFDAIADALGLDHGSVIRAAIDVWFEDPACSLIANAWTEDVKTAFARGAVE